MDTKMQSERENMQHTGEQFTSAASEMAEKGRETMRRMGNAWESAKNNIQERAATSARATDRAIRDHPYETIGIAFGVGVLLGVLINRK